MKFIFPVSTSYELIPQVAIDRLPSIPTKHQSTKRSRVVRWATELGLAQSADSFPATHSTKRTVCFFVLCNRHWFNKHERAVMMMMMMMIY